MIRLGGVTSSIQFVNIRAPRQRGGERSPMVLLELMPSGTRVKPGDVIARVDGQRLRDHIDDVHSTYLTADADIRKREAEQKVAWSNLEQSVLVAKADWDKWKLEDSAAEIRTVIDRELLDLGVEESEATYVQTQKDLGFTEESHTAELKILELTRERHARHRDRHGFDLERYTVVTPINGMVVRQQIFRGGDMSIVEEGDQVYPGMLFVKVMDLDNMQVEAKANQAESNLLRIGQRATVGLDAFPGAKFKGKIQSLGALARSGSESTWVREVPVNIYIEGADPRLIPDLSGYADVVIDRRDNVTQVPLSAVHEQDGQAYVYVKNGEQFDKRPIELGLQNFTHAEVNNRGVSEGEEIALDHPAA